MKLDKSKIKNAWEEGGRKVHKFCNYSIVPSRNRENVLVFVERVKVIPFILGILITCPFMLMMLIINALQGALELLGDWLMSNDWLSTTFHSINRHLLAREDPIYMKDFIKDKEYYLSIMSEDEYNKLLENFKENEEDE